MGPRSTQDRSKTGPRSSWMAFLPLDFSLRFLIVSESILVPFEAPKWLPGGAAGLMVIGPGAVQDGLGIVLVRSFFRLALRDRFFQPIGCLLESFWGAFGIVLGHLGLSWARFGSSWALLGSFLATPCSVLESYNPICPSTHRLINPSTQDFSALCDPGRRTARSD